MFLFKTGDVQLELNTYTKSHYLPIFHGLSHEHLLIKTHPLHVFLWLSLAPYWLFRWGPKNKILPQSLLEICFASTVNCTYLLTKTVSGRPTALHSSSIVHYSLWTYHWVAFPSNFVWCLGVLSRVRRKQMTLLPLYVPWAALRLLNF